MVFFCDIIGVLCKNTNTGIVANLTRISNCIFTAVYLCGYLYSLMGMKLQTASVASTMIQILKKKIKCSKVQLDFIDQETRGYWP